jgi:hypothetical protein
MSTGGTYWSLPGLLANATCTQFKVVRACTTAGYVTTASVKATDNLLGILQNDAGNGEPAEVAFMGVCMALSENSVTYGAKLTVSTTGRVTLRNADANECIGIALRAGDAGDKIPVMLSRFEMAS